MFSCSPAQQILIHQNQMTSVRLSVRDGWYSARYVQDPKLIIVSTEKPEVLALRGETRLFTAVAEPSLVIYSSTWFPIDLISIGMPRPLI